ncbi:MAG: helix-turn-helix domain-containing protein [Deltaproteobacteria bacterium]|nr:helix-turn-helix domain-containing protein [Deltaproteobacteria bacterium]
MSEPLKIVTVSLEELKSLIREAVAEVLKGDSGGQANGYDRLLTPAEAAAILNVKPRWLYRHANRLPFTRRLSRKALRFSEAGLFRWQAARKKI